jgi:hypothetical protein
MMKIRISGSGEARAPMTALLFVLLCCGPIQTATAQVYKWVDENGVTHYGERPPQNQKAQTVGTKPAIAPTTVPATAPAPDSPSAKPPDSGDLQQKNIEFQRRRIERERKAEQELKQAEDKRKRCNLARDDLKQAEGMDLYELNDKGERIFLDEAKRKAEIEQLRHRIEQFCTDPT